VNINITPEQAKLLDRLTDYVMTLCFCPCCGECQDCLSGCTYRDDDPDGWGNLAEARQAMWGDSAIC